jgi:hypothetical protein
MKKSLQAAVFWCSTIFVQEMHELQHGSIRVSQDV